MVEIPKKYYFLKYSSNSEARSNNIMPVITSIKIITVNIYFKTSRTPSQTTSSICAGLFFNVLYLPCYLLVQSLRMLPKRKEINNYAQREIIRQRALTYNMND